MRQANPISDESGENSTPGSRNFSEFMLEEYILGASVPARETSKRVFLTYLIATSRIPFTIPDSQSALLSNNKQTKLLTKCLKPIGYLGGWLATVLHMLDEKGARTRLSLSPLAIMVCVFQHGCVMPLLVQCSAPSHGIAPKTASTQHQRFDNLSPDSANHSGPTRRSWLAIQAKERGCTGLNTKLEGQLLVREWLSKISSGGSMGS